MSDRDCQRCHADSGMKATAAAKGNPLLAVDQAEMARSRHARIACVQCHTGGTPAEVTR